MGKRIIQTIYREHIAQIHTPEDDANRFDSHGQEDAHQGNEDQNDE